MVNLLLGTCVSYAIVADSSLGSRTSNSASYEYTLLEAAGNPLSHVEDPDNVLSSWLPPSPTLVLGAFWRRTNRWKDFVSLYLSNKIQITNEKFKNIKYYYKVKF